MLIISSFGFLGLKIVLFFFIKIHIIPISAHLTENNYIQDCILLNIVNRHNNKF